ncbi:MAG: hypothetical protein D6748_09630 [Calditrichaeota bacterium]|nr:MAG: hypothetical protein D6748_09630 [Calditrichota bacterium]
MSDNILFRRMLLSGFLLLIMGMGVYAQIWQTSLVDSFPRTPTPTKILQKAGAIDIDYQGNVYIIDRARHRLLKFSPSGQLIREVGGFGNAPEQFDDPRDVFAHTTLNVFVADYYNDRVVRFDNQLNFLNTLIPQWQPPYNFERVLSIAVSSQYDLFLLEDGEKKIIKFSRFSQPTDVFGGFSEVYGQLLEPVQLAINGSKHIFVSDVAQHSIVVFDYLGNYLTSLEHPLMQQPTGLHWGDDQLLYVVDQHSNTIFLYSDALKYSGQISLPFIRDRIVDVALFYSREKDKRLLYVLGPSRCWIVNVHP